MIIHEQPGDLFACQSQTITCPVNTAGAMGKGLALDFRDRVPGLFQFYRGRYGTRYSADRYANRLYTYKVPDGRQVLLFPTKVRWTDPASPTHIRENLRLLAEQYQELGITSLAIPALGCGLGKLNYDRDVRPMVQEFLGPLPLPVEVLFQHVHVTRW